MNKINKHIKIQVIIASSIFSFVTVSLVICAVKTHEKAERARIEAEELVETFESFRAVRFNISPENLKRALRNN
jgi:flagellar basal body-associated protein FliL